jgi:hypothetical protein
MGGPHRLVSSQPRSTRCLYATFLVPDDVIGLEQMFSSAPHYLQSDRISIGIFPDSTQGCTIRSIPRPVFP